MKPIISVKFAKLSKNIDDCFWWIQDGDYKYRQVFGVNYVTGKYSRGIQVMFIFALLSIVWLAPCDLCPGCNGSGVIEEEQRKCERCDGIGIIIK